MSDQPSPVPPVSPAAPPSSKTSGLAIASLVLGILGLTCILPIIGAILAVILGIVALNQINKSRGTVTGQGQAVAGLVLGGVGLVMIPIMAAMLLPALSSAREKARRAMCVTNMKQIGIAMAMYADQHDGKIPRKFDNLRPYASNLDKLLICPSSKNSGAPSYQIVLGGKNWNSSETADAIVLTEAPSNHRDDGHSVLYGDGRAAWVLNRSVPD